MSNVKPNYRISDMELRKRLQVNAMRKYLQTKRLLWYGHLERMEERSKSYSLK